MASAATSDAGAARAYETHRAVSRILAAHASLASSHVAAGHVEYWALDVRLFDCTLRSLLTCDPRLAGANKNGGHNLLCSGLSSDAAGRWQPTRLHYHRNPHFRPSIENVSSSSTILTMSFRLVVAAYKRSHFVILFSQQLKLF